MNKNIIINFLQSKQKINNIDITKIEELITLFPYCEIPRIINLIFKKTSNDLLFEQKLSESIIHINDRNSLFSLMNQKKPKKITEKEKNKHKKHKKKSFNDWLTNPIEKWDKQKESRTRKQYTQNKDDLMTETLAKLYIEQKHFNQAIRAYEILSLKYPKKSSFFVREIEKIKQLILMNDE